MLLARTTMGSQSQLPVFLSWSARRSRQLAERFREWLPTVNPSFHPWMSDQDLVAGDEWESTILSRARTARVCIACLTPENLTSPWIHFEAGAIRSRPNTRVYACLLDLNPAELARSPLSATQAVQHTNASHLWRMVRALNDMAPTGGRLHPDGLRERFDRSVSDITDISTAPAERLLRHPRSANAAFLLAQSASLHIQHDARQVRKALLELVDCLNHLAADEGYLHEAAKLIRRNAVWAICGAKSEDTGRVFYAANRWSRGQGRHIERVFLPPATPQESRAVLQVIQAHFRFRMRVRAFTSWPFPAVNVAFQLPPGFGMTLMGPRRASLEAVLVHWGGITSPPHHQGVILRSPAWLSHFSQLYDRISSRTVVVRQRNLDGFCTTFPDYGL
jgi:hypothetical protein